MATYEYRWMDTGESFTSHEYGLEKRWDGIARVYSFAFHRPMQPHFNPGLGIGVTSSAQLSDEMKRRSEQATARTGIPHDFAAGDMRDRDLFPVTMAGLDKTYDAHDASHPMRKVIESVDS